MNYPLISEYIEAIKAAEDNFDKLQHLRPVLGKDGEPVFSGGNFAVVFKMKDEQTGKLHAVKCFLKEQEGRAEAYRLIAEELEYVSSTFLTPIKYLDKELFVDTGQTTETEFPVLLMDWIDGQTLDKYIREHIDNQYELSLLAYQFSRLAMWLMPQPYAHGDLKPDNILVKDDGTLVLVDYDGMYVPAMKGQKARELGSPDFRHPSRTESDFDEHIDDFSLASILLSLKAIALQPSLMNEYGASDRLLFSEKDYLNICNCQLIREFSNFLSDNDFLNLYSFFLSALAQKTVSSSFTKQIHISRHSNFKNDEDVPSDIKEIQEKAINGDSSAQYELGGCYHFGHSVPKDYSKAVYWYYKAAKNNHSEAMNNLGCIYNDEVGTLRDLEKAVSFFRNSAEHGCLQGMYNLAGCYEDGHGVEQDLNISIFWYKRIIEKCHSDLGCCKACYKLFLFYQIGLGVEPNKDKYEYYLKLAKKNDFDGTWASSLKDEGKLPCPNVSTTDYEDFVEDEFGVMYSKDGYRLLSAPANLTSYCVRKGTKVICEEAFTKCATSLVSISIPKSLIAIAPNSFAGCSSLCEIHFEHDSLLCMIGAWAFSGCTSLKKVSLPNHVSAIGPGAFSYCNCLQEVYLPTSIFNNFFYQLHVDNKDINMPFAYKNYFIFEGCHSLKTIRVPYNSAEKFKGFFPASKSLQITDEIDLSFLSKLKRTKVRSSYNDNQNYKKNADEWIDDFGVKYSADKTKLLKAPSNVKKYSIRVGTISVSDRAFELCQSLESIIIPTSVTTIGDSAFMSCKQLDSVNIPHSVKSIGNFAFAGCSSLENLTLNDGINTLGGSVFKNCKNLRSITIPNSVDSFGDIIASRGQWIRSNRVSAFDGCDNLKYIYIPVGSKNKFKTLLTDYKDMLVEKIENNTITFDNSNVSLIERCRVYKDSDKWMMEVDFKTGKKIEHPLSLLLGNQNIKLDDQSIKKLEIIGLTLSEGFYVNSKAISITYEPPTTYLAKILFDADYMEISGIIWGLNNNINQWQIKGVRSFNLEERLAINRAEVVASQYGSSVCFFMNAGGQTYISLDDNSELCVGDEVNINTAKLITLCRKGKDDILRVIE